MKYYTNTVEAKDLYTALVGHITAVQPGQSTPWWINESSVSADGVFTSVGSDGSSRICIILRENVIGQKITYGIAEDYTPGPTNVAGTLLNSEISEMLYYTAVKTDTTLVRYDLVVTPDNIILRLSGDRGFTDFKSNVAYLGMILRYDPTDTKGVAKISHENNTKAASLATLLRDSNNNALASYNVITARNPRTPTAWGGHIVAEPIHLSLAAEGFRGELNGLFCVAVSNQYDNHIVKIGDKDFLLSTRTATGNNGFGTDTVAIRIS